MSTTAPTECSFYGVSYSRTMESPLTTHIHPSTNLLSFHCRALVITGSGVGLVDNPRPRRGVKLWTVSVIHNHIPTLRHKSIIIIILANDETLLLILSHIFYKLTLECSANHPETAYDNQAQ